ncbi:MAG TPA: DUF4037 domain-containing protein [Anaerolineae bacterium]|nr:DUF4037 domain-containing protein [Anaerolineae bacterium]
MSDPYAHIPFIPGLTLSTYFYQEAVAPLLHQHFPTLPYAAARLGPGSDVLGFDTPRSRDHAWGPRLTLYLTPSAYDQYAAIIDKTLRQHLPPTCHGYPTNFSPSANSGERVMLPTTTPPINHLITITTIENFFHNYLRYNITTPLTLAHWLTFPQQSLRTIASGRIFHDDFGTLTQLRHQLNYYPHDLWLYLLAAQWRRIAQEEPFLGRTGHAGDDLGSRLLAARLTQEIMRLCFYFDKQYIPYSKWFGTAFQKLTLAPQLNPLFDQLWAAPSWQQRETIINQAYQLVAQTHNNLNLGPPQPTTPTPFHDRPYLVIHAENFSQTTYNAITDPAVRALPPTLGSIDQFVDTTDILSYPDHFTLFRSLF